MGNDRIIVIQITLASENNLYLIGVYLPSTNSPINIFRNYLENLEDIIDELSNRGSVVILGDFNAHIGTHGGPRSFSNTNRPGLDLIALMKRMDLLSVNSLDFCHGPIATYFAMDGEVATTTDHILMKKDDVDMASCCNVQDDHQNNLSFHLPIFCSLSIEFNSRKLPIENRAPSLAWNLLSNKKIAERYRSTVKKCLPSADSDITNLTELESSVTKFTEALITSANKSIPRVKWKPHLKPFWNTKLSELSRETRRLRKEWIEYGRPRGRDHHSFVNYKEAKRKFRRLLRNKSLEHEIKDNDQLQKMFDIDRNKFQKAISRKRNNKTSTGNVLKISNRLVNDEDEVLDIWKNHYKGLYAVMENNDFDETFRIRIEQKIEEYSHKSFQCHDDPLEKEISVEEVREHCLKLPNGKAGGLDGLLYEHLKYADKVAHIQLTKIFNAMRELEDVPNSSTEGVIISLFKGKKKSKYDKDNYRGITLLNIMGKILERILLCRCMPFFEKNGLPNHLQFAYQKSKSSVLASFVLQEAILDSVENGSKVYGCFLDSAKAFDTVWIDGLFFKLFNLGIRGKTWRLLRKWYSKMSCCVAVNNRVSAPFAVKQGVRQGGVLSPWLFMCFNNDITKEISDTGFGVVTSFSTYCGNVNVADDIALISPRVAGLQSMIAVMEQYSRKWRFNFNVTKTEAIVFGESSSVKVKNKEQRTWVLDNMPIVENNNCEHVGITLTGDFSSSTRTKDVCKKGKEVIFSLMNVGVRPGGLNPLCAVELWKSVGLPKMLYGSELWWNLTQTDLELLERVHRLAAKRSQGLCPTTKSEAAIGNLGLWTVDGYIDKIKLLFFQNLVRSSPETVHKDIFIKRLLNYMYRITCHQRGYIPDIINILEKYDLQDYLIEYLQSGEFPTKREWKTLIKKKIHNTQIQSWKTGILLKPELGLYSAVHNNLEFLELWNVAFRHPLYLKAISNMVNILCGNIPSAMMSAVVECETAYKCTFCNNNIKNIAYHYIMECYITMQERNKLWDLLQDRLPVAICAKLFSEDDESMYINLFSSIALNTNDRDNISDPFLLTVSQGMLQIFSKLSSTLNSQDD